MADQREADKLWKEILQVEADKPPTGASETALKAFFKSKGKEMAKLKAAYAKAVGRSCDPHDDAQRQQVQNKKLMGGFGLKGGVAPGKHTTGEDL